MRIFEKAGSLAALFVLAILAASPCPGQESATGISPLHVSEGTISDSLYMVGPGDVFVVTMLGEAQQSFTVPVTPEGTVVVPPAGSIAVADMTLRQAKSEVIRVLSRYYRGVEIQFTLTKLRRFEIHVLGQVNDPGTYIVTPVTRVSAAIDMAGGFLEKGSRRRVAIHRADGSKALADVLRFERLGERKWNPFVSDGDLILVPVALGYATVFGMVALPGTYEVVPGEKISDFLRIAGDFTDDAVREDVEIRRFLSDDPSRTSGFRVDFMKDPPSSGEPDLFVHSGDEIFVRGVPQWHLHRGVLVTGEVKYPGVYVVDEGSERLAGIVNRAGGFTEDADLYEATLTRQSFLSEAEDREYERLRTMPVVDMTEDEYAYFKMRSREKKEQVVVDFEALFRRGDPEQDVLLRRGDIITVPQLSRTITVSGQIVNPGRIPFKEGEDYRYYVTRAGGYAARASKGKIRIIKGSTGIWFDRGETKLEPGDTIWIPEKPDRDYWELFKDFMTVAAQVATVYLVVDQATK
ncbi:MAG: SLBB domain-containing protein [Candidatus Eisenbacteria bacterium]